MSKIKLIPFTINYDQINHKLVLPQWPPSLTYIWSGLANASMDLKSLLWVWIKLGLFNPFLSWSKVTLFNYLSFPGDFSTYKTVSFGPFIKNLIWFFVKAVNFFTSSIFLTTVVFVYSFQYQYASSVTVNSPMSSLSFDSINFI